MIGVSIRQAGTAQDIELARALFREYAEQLGVDLCFQGFQEELDNLPGKYTPPAGRLFLAYADGEAVGCVGLRPLDGSVCEMKRLYVRPDRRGQGIGRLLAQAAVDAARQVGYRRMVLDTLETMQPALAVYRTMGFEPAEPYYANPLSGVLYLGLDLLGTQVFKVSGSDLDDPEFSRRFAACIALAAKKGVRPIVVHGGGKELTALLATMRIESKFVDGLRVTDARTRDAALMVLSGLANKRLVASLVAEGLDALGVSGLDAGLVRVQPVDPALEFVGKPVQVRAELLKAWVERGLVPVIAPMSLGMDGHIYNVNADHVAGAIAAAVEASLLTFVTNVPGVLDADGNRVEVLAAGKAEEWITHGTIRGGMVPKVRSALEALEGGVRRVRITDLAGVGEGKGTVFER